MKVLVLYIFVLFSTVGFSQESISELLNTYNSENVPYITVQELAILKNKVIILDARETEEYKVSHLKNAIYVGYDNFNLKTVEKQIPNKKQPIIVYCSLGVRSEDIARNLIDAGYTDVKNLYGGIFEWKNKDYSVYSVQEKETDSIHVFSKKWSKWLKKGIKIYE